MEGDPTGAPSSDRSEAVAWVIPFISDLYLMGLYAVMIPTCYNAQLNHGCDAWKHANTFSLSC